MGHEVLILDKNHKEMHSNAGKAKEMEQKEKEKKRKETKKIAGVSFKTFYLF